MIVLGSFALSLLVLIDREVFNRILDYIVPIFTIAAIAAIVAFHRKRISSSSNEDSGENKYRIFRFTKKSKDSSNPSDWRQKFVGTWEKTERVGFDDVTLYIISTS